MNSIPSVSHHRNRDMDLTYVFAFIRNGFNAKRAALEAGFSEITASQKAGRWIASMRADSTKPDLWDIVHDHMERQITHLDVTENRILEEYARIAFFDPLQMFDPETGEFLHPTKMPEDVRRVIGNFEVVEDGFLQRIVKMKMIDKKHALDSLARHMGMFKETVQVQHSFSEFLKNVTEEASAEPLVIGDGTNDMETIEMVPGGGEDES